MAYKRQISYFDLIEDEQKRGNAGFAKWEKYDECHILSVFVNGLGDVHAKEVKVFLDESTLGMLNIRNGRAEGTYLLTRGEKDWKEAIGRIRIPIEEGKVLIAEFEQHEKTEVKENNDNVVVMPQQPEVSEEENVENEELEELEEILLDACKEQEDEMESVEYPQEEQENPEPVKSLWEKLGETHEPFYPFDNDVECYRIFPKELKFLREDYHSLQNNQFLLHGYYNYRYLLIFRKEDSQNEYWLGVPGIYHEREKMAARMFGFEKFEGVKRNYRTGDLGYYLVTVE